MAWGSAGSPLTTPATDARPATVWFTKRSLTANRRPACRARDTTSMLRIESPPRLKKLSSTPTRSTPSTSAQICASVASAPVRGATKRAAAAAKSGAGRALRSSLPLGVRGSASSATKAEGTM